MWMLIWTNGLHQASFLHWESQFVDALNNLAGCEVSLINNFGNINISYELWKGLLFPNYLSPLDYQLAATKLSQHIDHESPLSSRLVDSLGWIKVLKPFETQNLYFAERTETLWQLIYSVVVNVQSLEPLPILWFGWELLNLVVIENQF